MIVQLIDDLIRQQIMLTSDGEGLSLKAPTGAVTPEILEKIKANKTDIINYLTANEPGNSGDTVIQTAPTHSDYPLAAAQKRIWAIDTIQGGSTEYNIQVLRYVSQPLNLESAQHALSTILKRHEVLRTGIVEREGHPRQQIVQDCPAQIQVFRPTDGQHAEEAIEAFLQRDGRQIFSLDTPPLLRMSYLDLNGLEHPYPGLLLLMMHHIISDAWSMQILQYEFQASYLGQDLPPLAIQYKDYAFWQHECERQGRYHKQLDYWRGQMSDAPPLHQMPLCHPRPINKQHVGASIVSQWPAEKSQKLTAFAKENGLSPFMLVHAALALVVARHSNLTDIVIGTPVANRLRPELHAVIGCFVNTLVLRAKTSHPTVRQYLQHIKAVNLQAQANQDVAFEQLVEELNVPRSAAYTPLFQIMLNHNNVNFSIGEAPSDSDSTLQFIPIPSTHQNAKFDLALNSVVNEQGASFQWVFDSALFSQQKVSKISGHFNNLLYALIQSPEQQPEVLPMLDDREYQWLIEGVNNTAQPLVTQKQLINSFLQAHSVLLGPLPCPARMGR